MNYLTEAEWEDFIAGVDNPRDHAMFTVTYWRGLRASEVGLIRRSDVDLRAKRISIRRLKGSAEGIFDLSPAEVYALTDWMTDKRCDTDLEAQLFPIKRAQVFNLFRRYAQKAGIPKHKQHPHILKHSIATHLLDKNVDIVDVKDWLGHAAIGSTMVYADYTNARRRRVAKQVYSEEK